MHLNHIYDFNIMRFIYFENFTWIGGTFWIAYLLDCFQVVWILGQGNIEEHNLKHQFGILVFVKKIVNYQR